MTDFPPHSAAVLVHGAWADGSCWDNVVLPIAARRSSRDLRAQGDDFRTFLGDFVAALPQAAFPASFGL